jgi:threonine/homoserine/homoserine lactone efflux protein
MLNLVTIFFTSFIVGLSGAMMPGPVLTVAINETYRKGFWAGPLLVLGHAFLELALVISLVLGLGRILQNSILIGLVGMGGGLFLFWMGWDIVRSAVKQELPMGGEKENVSRKFGPVVAGITVSISNPYWTIWWVTVGAGFVIQSLRFKYLGLAIFYGGHIMADLAWYSLVSLAIVTGKRILSDRIYRGLLTFCGLFLICLAVYFAYSGVVFIG